MPPELPELLRKRDPDLARRIYPFLAWMVDHYYRAEVDGIEHLSDSRFLGVATHNGSLYTPDFYCLLVAFWRRFGLETPGYGLMHKAAFKIPLLGSLLTRLGALPACQENGSIALRAGFPVLVCPGGDLDALKPFARRHRITFGGRRGFVRLALREQAPIVPVVSVGAHETLFILNDGRRFAELIGFSRFLRIKTVPFSFGFPFGFGIAGVGTIPLPSKIRLKVLPRIELAEPASAADDPEAVERCFRHVRDTMQRGLDELASRRRRVLLG